MAERNEELRAREDAVALAVRARELKATGAVVLEVGGITFLFRTVVILTAMSRRHAQSLAQDLLAEAKRRTMFKLGVEGVEEGNWILLDLADVVVHVFLPELREFYDLETLWADAPRVELPPEPAPNS